MSPTAICRWGKVKEKGTGGLGHTERSLRQKGASQPLGEDPHPPPQRRRHTRSSEGSHGDPAQHRMTRRLPEGRNGEVWSLRAPEGCLAVLWQNDKCGR